MAKIKKEKEPERVIRTDFTDQELDELDRELEPYRSNVKIGGEPARILTLGGELAFLKDKGVIKVEGELKKRMNCMSDCPHWRVYAGRDVEYQEIENELKALKFKKGKRGFAEIMELNWLDEVV